MYEMHESACYIIYTCVCSDAHLVLMAGALAVLGETLHGLVDESHVLLINIEPQQTQASCGTATDAVKELQCLTHQIIIVLVVLTTQEVLERQRDRQRWRRYSLVENVSTGYKGCVLVLEHMGLRKNTHRDESICL